MNAITNPLTSLPSTEATPSSSLLTVVDETARRNRIMFSGYQKLIHYLATANDCNPQDIKNIILEILDQIA